MLTRRLFTVGATTSLLAAPHILRAQSAPLRVGWITVLTGPSSAPGHGYHRGMEYAVKKLNDAGGIAGRQIELVIRDTAGAPDKAVNAVTELSVRGNVDMIWGPSSSGEALAANAIMSRYGKPNLTPSFIDILIDPAKNPNIFRVAPTQSQLELAIGDYIHNRRQIKEVAVVSDTAGYGLAAAAGQVKYSKELGGDVVYQAQIDANQPDVTPDVIRARDSGAKALVPWSVNAGLLARLMNARASIGWDVPIIGHSALGAGEVKNLLDKPGNWENVMSVGFRRCSYGADGKLPQATQAFVEDVSKSTRLDDTLLFWVATGNDAIMNYAKAVELTGGDVSSAAVIEAFNTKGPFSGILSDWTYSVDNHNGMGNDEVVMVKSNSYANGAFTLAEGYA